MQGDAPAARRGTPGHAPALALRSGLLALRPLSPADHPTLARWLSDARVLEFYEGRDRPHTLETVAAVFAPSETESRAIVSYAGRDIAYLQVYTLDAADKAEFGYADAATVFGMDQFIGEPDHWDRGIGTLIVGTVSRWLVAACGADHVVVDPQTGNARAIRCYEKCGFRRVRLLPRHELHEGALRDCWLMEFPGVGAGAGGP